jgi:hypothetical protein
MDVTVGWENSQLFYITYIYKSGERYTVEKIVGYVVTVSEIVIHIITVGEIVDHQCLTFFSKKLWIMMA